MNPQEQKLREEWRAEFDPHLADKDIPWQIRQRMEEWAGRKLSQAIQTERESLREKVEAIPTVTMYHPKMFGGQIEVNYVDKRDVLALLQAKK